MLANTNGIPNIITIGTRRYVACAEPIRRADGTLSQTVCGNLIEITHSVGIRITDRCSDSHAEAANEPFEEIGPVVRDSMPLVHVHADGTPVEQAL